MKEVLLLRHAKSDWSHGDLDDIDRPLNERGVHDADMMGRFLKNSDVLPGQVYLSPACRVQETWQGVSAHWKHDFQVEIIPHLYLAHVNALYSAVIQSPVDVDRILIIAHNPGMEEIISHLCGVDVNVKMATATLAQLVTDTSQWGQIQPGGMVLKGLIYPRILKKIF